MLVANNTFNRLTGFYMGKVLKHCADGKCKVFIYGVNSEEWKTAPDKLPDALPAAPLNGGTYGDGNFLYPNIGSIVWCFFANEDLNRPVFFATSYGGTSANKQYGLLSTDINLSDDYDADKLQHDYIKSTPTVCHLNGNSNITTRADGKISISTGRHTNTKVVTPASPYSATMHAYKTLKSSVFPEHEAYYVYKADELSAVTLRAVQRYDIDDLVAPTLDLPDDNIDCIGLSCHFQQSAAEDSLLTQIATELTKPDVDCLLVCNSAEFGPRPKGNGIFNVFICMEGMDKYLTHCENADLYIANSLQFINGPLYWDKLFNADYKSQSKDDVYKSVVNADVSKYNTNILLFDPIKTDASTYYSKDGRITHTTYNTKNESIIELAQTGEGVLSAKGFKYFSTDDTTLLGTVSAMSHYNYDFNLSSGGLSSINRYILVNDTSDTAYLISSYVQNTFDTSVMEHILLSSTVSDPENIVASGYDDYGNMATPIVDKPINEIQNSHIVSAIVGLDTVEQLSNVYDSSGTILMGISSVISSSVCDGLMKIELFKIDYSGGLTSYARYTATAEGHLSVESTIDVDLFAWSPNEPDTWAHFNFGNNGSIVVNSTVDMDVAIGEAATPSDRPSVGSFMHLTKDGDIKINSTNSILIDAPSITLNGTTYNAKFSDMTTKSDTSTSNFSDMTTKSGTMNITGDSGDCKILNVSLLNHVHKEMQAGDVVSPGVPTMTATASN